MLQQEVRAGFAASSASDIGLQVEMSALRAEVQHGFEQNPVRIGSADEIAMAVQSVQKALLRDLRVFFLFAGLPNHNTLIELIADFQVTG